MKKISVQYILILFVVMVLMAGKVFAYDGNNYDPYYYNWWSMNYQTQVAKAASVLVGAENEQDALTADEWKMIELVNQERVAHGLKPLQVDLRLVNLARVKANDLIVNNYFDHQSPTLGSPFDQMRLAGIQYRYAGENLAGSPSVERAHNALMNSPSHRANILSNKYTHIGVGVINGGPYGMMFVQHFIQTK